MIGDIYKVSRGVMTSANSVFWIDKVEKTDRWPDIAYVKTSGGRGVQSRKIRLETDLLRPLLRGRNVDDWSYNIENYIIWTHDDETGKVRSNLPSKAQSYFREAEIQDKLENRADYSQGDLIWKIFRTSEEKLKDRVAFQGIAKEIEAVYVPSEHKDEKLGKAKIILDANVYFISVENEKLGYKFAGLLNSTPVRVYYSAYAMRTGAQYCAFRSWMMGLIPIPRDSLKEDEKLSEISQELHEIGEDEEFLEKLDKRVAELYGLTEDELSSMKDFLDFFVN